MGRVSPGRRLVHEAFWYGAVAPTACKVMQLLLRYRTAPASKDDACSATKHRDMHAKTLLTIKPSCKDEARVGQKGGHTYVWAEVGSRPPMIRDNRHDSAYIFGAMAPST